MKAISLRKLVIAVVIIGIATGYARADKQQLQAKLSRDVEIQLTDVTIAEALENIGHAAGVKIVLSDDAEWKLPLGEATRLSVALSGPLADSLAEMLNALFMRYAVGDDEITIYPRQELEHIIGRPSTKQLELLKIFYSVNITFEDEVSPGDVVSIIRRSIGEISFVPYYIPEVICEILSKMAIDGRSFPVTLAILLEQAGNERNTPYWYISGMDFPNQVPVIRIVDEEDFRKAVLEQVVDISFEGKRADRADVILQRLARWTGMELLVSKDDPSWLEEIIAVNMQNITLKQALRNIVSTVDGEISIFIDRNAMFVNGPKHRRKAAVSAKTKSTGGAGEGYVGKISIPMDGGKYFIEFMLRESDLTEELKKLREEKIKEVIQKTASEQKLREALKNAAESTPTPPK